MNPNQLLGIGCIVLAVLLLLLNIKSYRNQRRLRYRRRVEQGGYANLNKSNLKLLLEVGLLIMGILLLTLK